MLMLDQAYVMDDGRRVFKSEDGSYVIDEHGQRVSPDELDFDLISRDKPTAEQYRAGLDARQSLLQEKKKILEFQEKLDDAREKIEDGDLSKQELDDLDAELNAAMPQSVKRHAAHIAPDDQTPDLASDSPEPEQSNQSILHHPSSSPMTLG